LGDACKKLGAGKQFTIKRRKKIAYIVIGIGLASTVLTLAPVINVTLAGGPIATFGAPGTQFLYVSATFQLFHWGGVWVVYGYGWNGSSYHNNTVVTSYRYEVCIFGHPTGLQRLLPCGR
jgi:hypothetical protein